MSAQIRIYRSHHKIALCETVELLKAIEQIFQLSPHFRFTSEELFPFSHLVIARLCKGSIQEPHKIKHYVTPRSLVKKREKKKIRKFIHSLVPTHFLHAYKLLSCHGKLQTMPKAEL